MAKPKEGRSRVVIENVEPQINCGVFPIKRIVNDFVVVEADVFGDGHDHVRARLLWKRDGESSWQTAEMIALGNDRWRGQFPVTYVGRYRYTLVGEVDHFETWQSDLKKRAEAQQDLEVAFATGAQLLEQLQGRASKEDGTQVAAWAEKLRSGGKPSTLLEFALQSELRTVVNRYPDPATETWYERELEVVVDRKRAVFSAWYELFPRSWSKTPGKHGTLRDVAERMDYAAEMGFDVLYLPPISPIGKSFRKGKNNSVQAAPGDEGSPWAIGSAEGGHTAIHPALGTLQDFAVLVKRARELKMEIALDIAFQCSPDHPWVTEHPEFFRKRPDGSIQYAENPPKKYQDIYPLDFESSNWQGLWDALKGVFSFWIDQGVQIFRVDNPHTKAFPFWQWVIPELKAESPDVLFLAEAFTRPRVMERLAKLGFSQSYTYFTWRETKEELTQYMLELTTTQVKEYFRPNFWPNTPDILPGHLQAGGLPAFRSRLVLATTLTSNYGIYGPAFELGENVPVRTGSEEYLNSEKYEIKTWDLTNPLSLKPLITRLNLIRREHPALQSNDRLHFHPTDNPSLMCYSKRTSDGSNLILVVVNLDPFLVQNGWVSLDLEALGLRANDTFEVYDLLADHTYHWRGSRNYVELRPAEAPAHILLVTPPGATPYQVTTMVSI
ncbi:MAG TPA: alpha-1,4-glucan--maltose-1-phosphate maltosyltransferase [Acidobacteriaceae bacterium]|nr:alpha-1,4-glucan--maltose-1-phosphate maltosyltransferase [Acidobacteriaceae bacterium]